MARETAPLRIEIGVPIIFRARWCHPTGARLGLVGSFLYRAGVTGGWRRVGEYTAQAAQKYARARGYRHAACQNNGVAIPLDHVLPKANQDSSVDFGRMMAAGARNRPTRVVTGRGGLMLEQVRATVPASSLLDGTPGCEVRYLRQLAKHRRAARASGMVGWQDVVPRATPDERRALKRRQQRNKRRAAKARRAAEAGGAA